jgi:hypothetical protein
MVWDTGTWSPEVSDVDEALKKGGDVLAKAFFYALLRKRTGSILDREN